MARQTVLSYSNAVLWPGDECIWSPDMMPGGQGRVQKWIVCLPTRGLFDNTPGHPFLCLSVGSVWESLVWLWYHISSLVLAPGLEIYSHEGISTFGNSCCMKY